MDLYYFISQKYCPLFEPFCEKGTPQLMLLREIQSYCAKSATFIKLFPRIVLHLYKSERGGREREGGRERVTNVYFTVLYCE